MRTNACSTATVIMADAREHERDDDADYSTHAFILPQRTQNEKHENITSTYANYDRAAKDHTVHT
jgi:hypothetical protein